MTELTVTKKQMAAIKSSVAWSLISVLYFKVSFDAGYRGDISIIAASIMGVGFGFITHYLSEHFLLMLVSHVYDSKLAILPGLFLPSIVSLGAFAIFSKLVIYGFSKKLNYYVWKYDDDVFLFLLIIAAAFLVYMLNFYRTAVFYTEADLDILKQKQQDRAG